MRTVIIMEPVLAITDRVSCHRFVVDGLERVLVDWFVAVRLIDSVPNVLALYYYAGKMGRLRLAVVVKKNFLGCKSRRDSRHF